MRGAPPPAASWSVREPAHAYGPTLREELATHGIDATPGDGGAVHVEVIASRVPLPAAERDRLRARCAAGPVIAVALQADDILDDLDAAAMRVSACDPTPLTRRVVARRIAAAVRA